MVFKDVVTDVKFWIGAIILFVTVLAFATGFIELPKKVEKQEVRLSETKQSVDKLADTVDDYITEQRVVQREADKRETLMLRLITKDETTEGDSI